MGLFITFEGGEGSGKSTHLKTLANDLKTLKYKVLSIHDPGSTELGKKIRPLILDKKYKISREAELLLYLAARAEMVNKRIIPNLKKYDFILCDRYFDSTVIYQGIIKKWDEAPMVEDEFFLDFMHTVFSKNLIPDYTFLFDVDPEIGLRRSLGESKNESRWESKGVKIHEVINQGFLNRAFDDSDRFVIIDANQELKKVYLDLQMEFDPIIEHCSVRGNNAKLR